MTSSSVVKLFTVVCLCTVGLTVALVTAQDDADTQAKIENAMSAAPLAIAENATILDYPTEGTEFVVLREGSNGWSCLPDWTISPGNDPMCLDPMFTIWFEAYMAGTEPEITTPGLAYMLQGGSDASNIDPMAMEPAAGEDWVSTPPHVMILFPAELDLNVFSIDHMSGEPYVMWAGTPYEHIMMPIAAGEHEHSTD
jgi:hypothetical protein